MAEGSTAQRVRRTKAEQRAETLEQILDAAEYLFSKNGLHGVTLRDRRTLDLANPVLAFEGLKQVDRPLPPFFLPCGTWDLLMGDSRRMLKALHQLGSTKSEAREYPRGPHAFHAFVMTPQALRCWKDTFAFLSTHV